MKLIPYMIYIDYNHDVNLFEDKSLPIKEIIIDKKINYDTTNHYWFSKNHYRAKVEVGDLWETRFLQIGFKLEDNLDSIEDITVQYKPNDKEPPILLSYSKKYNVWYQKSVFQDRRNDKTGYYFPSERTKDLLRGLNHSGELDVEVYLKKEFILKERVLFLPSSISISDYNLMISDLYRIRESLVINEKMNIQISSIKETTIDTLERLISEIEGPIQYINKFPSSNLIIEKKYIKDKSISGFQPEVEIQRQIAPGKQKYKASVKKENLSIRENLIIKQMLKKLSDYAVKLIAPKEIVEADKKEIINELTSILQKSSKRIRRIAEKVGIENLNKSTIGELYNDIKREINLKNEQILFRKNFLINKLNENNANYFEERNNGIWVILDLKIFAKYHQKGLDYSSGRIKVQIGSGKIPDDKKPSIFFKGYRYLKNNQWVAPVEVKSIFCDIFNSSISNRQQLVVLKALNDCLGSKEIDDEGINFSIMGCINPDGKFSNDIDIIGKPKMNSVYKIYKFDFERIQSVIINNREYVLQVQNNEIIEELSALLLHHDQNVQEFQEKILQLESEEQIVSKLSQLIKQKKFNIEEAERYKTIATQAINLSKLKIFRDINDTKGEPLIPSQLFLHDPYYKKVWKSLNDIEEVIGAALIPGGINKGIGVNKVNEIFEVWSLIKMISILTKKMGWTIANKKNLIECVDSFLLKNKKLKGFLISLMMGDLILEITYEPKVAFQGDKYSKEPDYRFLFKRLTPWGSIEDIGVVYLDAKYRNYKEQDEITQGDQEWKKDIVEVAIEKYGNKIHKNNPYIKTIASFILHPDVKLGMEKELKGENYFAFYNKNLFPGLLEAQNHEVVHKYGSIYLLPTATYSFVNWFKMLMEFRLNMYEVCWSCGNLNNIQRVTKFTGKGYPKYHYHCENAKCNEYWVKNHCSVKGHKLVKHVNNFHRQKSQDYEWYVVCPTCGDGYQHL